MGYVIAIVIWGLIWGFATKSVNESKGYQGGFWLGFFLGFIGLIIVACKTENREKKETKKISEAKETNEEISFKQILDYIELYNEKVISKEEFLDRKNKIWPQINKCLNNVLDLKTIKKGCESGLFTEKEYEEVKNATLNENYIVTFVVEFDGSIIDKIEVQARRGATEEEIEEIVREKKYTSKISKIYQKN